MKPYALAFLLLATAACERSSGAEGAAALSGGGGPIRHDVAAPLDTAGLRDAPVPAELAGGERLFEDNCLQCHGEVALGTQQGPPLVHIYYEPNHHADIAFIYAVERGVRAHHWSFGDMPPMPQVSRDQLMAILGYVRWLQREAGVY